MTGKELKELRKTAGFDQSELAQIIGASTSLIQKVEGGYRNLNGIAADTMYKLTIALRCNLSDLLDINGCKQMVFENLASFLAAIEMDTGCHTDEPEDYDSELGFYLSNAAGDGYLVYLTDNWVEDDEDAIEVQEMVVEKIRERCDG